MFSLISGLCPTYQWPLHGQKATRITPPTLADLRRDIDRIDEAMHRLLMERGDIIDRLISVKQTQETGSAFRPAREADMMRRLVERHTASCRSTPPRASGASSSRPSPTCRRRSRCTPISPPATPQCATARASISASPCRSCRIWARPAWSRQFPNPKAISAWCRPSRRRHAAPGGTRWSSTSAPKIIARLPFVDRADHPAALPVFVVSRVAPDAMVHRSRDLERAGRRAGAPTPAQRGRQLAEMIAVPDRAFDGAALLVSVPAGGKLEDGHRGAGQGRRLGALLGPRRQPRDPLYGCRPRRPDRR